MDKLTSIKLKLKDGNYSSEIPVTVRGDNVVYDGTHNILDVINIATKGFKLAQKADDMTDTDNFYVYIGPDNTYQFDDVLLVNNNWYYHNGSNWISGGLAVSCPISNAEIDTIMGLS